MDITRFDNAVQTTGVLGLLYICIVLVCIALAWWALQAIRFDVFLRSPKSGQAKLLQIMLAVIVGYQFAKFIFDYFQWSTLLRLMF